MKNYLLYIALLGLAASACGEPPPEDVASTESPIVGGEDAPVGALPYIVGIFSPAEDGDEASDLQFCGGTLIDARRGLVITAAHCVSDEYALTDPPTEEPEDWAAGAYAPEWIKVTIGSHALSEIEPDDYLDVTEVIVHPDFNYVDLTSDIAILRVAGVDPSTPTPRLIGHRFQDPWLVTPGLQATVAGWGELDSQTGETPDVLQWVRVPIMDRNVCNLLLDEEDGPEVDHTMLCAGPLFGGRDSCYGDSGGPLLVRDLDGRRVLAGIVSWGADDCAQPLKAGVYASVLALRPWVDACTTPGATCARMPPFPEDAF